MKKFEYIRTQFDFGDLDRLNRLGGGGWRVIAVTDVPRALIGEPDHYALLEREIPAKDTPSK